MATFDSIVTRACFPYLLTVCREKTTAFFKFSMKCNQTHLLPSSIMRKRNINSVLNTNILQYFTWIVFPSALSWYYETIGDRECEIVSQNYLHDATKLEFLSLNFFHQLRILSTRCELNGKALTVQLWESSQHHGNICKMVISATLFIDNFSLPNFF